MTQVTPEDIAKFREKLQDPDAATALAEIEDCEGNLEDATMVLAIRVGQQPDIANAEWLESLAKKCRAIICREENRNALLSDDYAAVIRSLATTKICPPLLITPVLMYVLQQGVDSFCEPLDTIS
ncbi:hypothetical protein [Chroogloeocystis siderophila]|jgi:hypothetical protein|uniref:Uncharacterized protein n=1 Tax=Chroogloeocystis siderophila 5.2 s.c.1 TaxID=247279 RepID=A0A1U7HQE6_9CHRO|nr:hypothetical protein [Chroogloeocystis siderophila]OKH25812.1 hypothetical protein NIES1031_12485 [Chroogloeocystis siderophila 5.2 s.c.1]